MPRARITAPYWGKPDHHFVAVPSAIGECAWQYKLAEGVRAFVSINMSTRKSEFRVEGLGLLNVWRKVSGGPQMAANEAKRQVDELLGKVRAA